MKLNPITKRLYTDEGEPIKQLHCPYPMSWATLESTVDPSVRRCTVCERGIKDTDGLSDEAVLAIVQDDPSACLKVALGQDNIRVVYRDVW